MIERFGGVAAVGVLAAVAAGCLLAVGGLELGAAVAWGVAGTGVVALVALLLAVQRLASDSRNARTEAQRARAAIDLLEDAVLVVDVETLTVRYANRAADQLAGGSVLGYHPWAVGPWPDETRLRAALDHSGETGDDSAALTVPHDDRVLEVSVAPVAWAGDAAAVVLARDITERHEAEASLEERERRFRALAEDAAGVVYRVRVRPEIEFEYVSPQLVEVIGFQPAELYVDPGLLVRRARPEHRASLDLSGEDHVYGEQGIHSYSVRHADGRWRWVEDHHTPEFDDAGDLVAVQGIAFDVSTKWETEKALGDALRQQEVAAETMHRTARVERTFLQSISHEIRTPMTSALGFARMLHGQREKIPAKQQDALLERLVANIERIEELVGQFLEFDRYARGTAEINRTLERLDELASSVAERVDMEGRQLECRLELVMALVDRRRIEQAVEDLLRNAVRHTPPETTVRLVVTATDEVAQLVVEDDGPGVAPEVAGHVFDPFTQGPASQDAANPGVGLGLAMVRVSARLHGGEVRHEEASPRGARFIVELPLASMDRASQEPATHGH